MSACYLALQDCMDKRTNKHPHYNHLQYLFGITVFSSSTPVCTVHTNYYTSIPSNNTLPYTLYSTTTLILTTMRTLGTLLSATIPPRLPLPFLSFFFSSSLYSSLLLYFSLLSLSLNKLELCISSFHLCNHGPASGHLPPPPISARLFFPDITENYPKTSLTMAASNDLRGWAMSGISGLGEFADSSSLTI